MCTKNKNKINKYYKIQLLNRKIKKLIKIIYSNDDY